MTELQTQQINLLLNTENPFAKSVYESFLRMDDSSAQLVSVVIMDIIRSYYVIFKQEVILKSPLIWSVEAYINVYNILYPGKYKLLHYYPTHFIRDDVDEDIELIFNETICIGLDGKYYLCDGVLEPKDIGYDTFDELVKTHGIKICL